LEWVQLPDVQEYVGSFRRTERKPRRVTRAKNTAKPHRVRVWNQRRMQESPADIDRDRRETEEKNTSQIQRGLTIRSRKHRGSRRNPKKGLCGRITETEVGRLIRPAAGVILPEGLRCCGWGGLREMVRKDRPSNTAISARGDVSWEEFTVG